MNRVPGIYGDISDDAQRAYGRWMLALFEHAEHVVECRNGCHGALSGCEDGRSLHTAEQQRWREWDALRRGESIDDA